MKGKSRYFINRNEKVAPIKFGDETLDVTVRVPSNYEHDSMMEKYTEYGQDGSIVTHGADLIQDRLVKFIIDLPFEIPVDESMNDFIEWKDATVGEKQLAVNIMDPIIRDAINNVITATEEVDDKSAEN
jgi:hypothetical protein